MPHYRDDIIPSHWTYPGPPRNHSVSGDLSGDLSNNLLGYDNGDIFDPVDNMSSDNLSDLLDYSTGNLSSRMFDVDAVSYHSDAIISILKQLSNLRVIVFTLAGMLIIQSFALGIVIGAIR
jgi:hypothetical protein